MLSILCLVALGVIILVLAVLAANMLSSRISESKRAAGFEPDEDGRFRKS